MEKRARNKFERLFPRLLKYAEDTNKIVVFENGTRVLLITKNEDHELYLYISNTLRILDDDDWRNKIVNEQKLCWKRYEQGQALKLKQRNQSRKTARQEQRERVKRELKLEANN